MKRFIMVMSCIGVALVSPSWAIPSSITYQGNLKQQGLPASGTKNMLFRITNLDGTQVYWSSGNVSVSVTNGLFSVHISPTGVNWQSVTPYIEVSVEGQILLPREPVNATVYAAVSNSIIDGAITQNKVSAGFGLVPSGGIVLFAANCPSGWSRFTALDNAFPMGSDTYGTTGGSSTHTHSISTDGAHNHGGTTGETTLTLPSNAGANFLSVSPHHVHSISMDGAHNHGGATGAASSLPPYITMVYCQKQ